MIIDLHTHTTPWSDDSSLTPAELICRAKGVGLDGLCLTEHDWFWDADAVARLSEEHNFIVLPGVEITTEEGHLLVFGVNKYVFGMHHAKFVKRIVDEVGGAIVVAHPYRRQFEAKDNDAYYPAVDRACENPIFLLADAIEVSNGRGTGHQNGFSLEVARKLNLKGSGGSDAHSPRDVGSYATVFERRIECVGELIVELKEGRFGAANLEGLGDRDSPLL